MNRLNARTRAGIVLTIATALALGLLAESPRTAAADGTPVPPVALLAGHPRLLVTPATLAGLRTKLAAGAAFHNHFRAWVAWADGQFGNTYYNDQKDLAADFALIWLTHPVPGVPYGRPRSDYGQRARQILLDMAQQNQQPTEQGWGAPLAYDWIWPLLTTADKQMLVNWFKTAYLISDPNPFNSQVVSGRMTAVLIGLATAGDGIDDAWAAAQVQKYYSFFDGPTGVTRSESDLVGEDGGAGQGDSYGLMYTAPMVILTEEAWRTANGISRNDHYLGPGKSFIRRLPQHVAYTILPWAVSKASPGGREYVLWKSQYQTAGLPVAQLGYRGWLTALTGVLSTIQPDMAALAQWLLQNRVGYLSNDHPSHLRWAWWKFLMGDLVEPKSPASLGLPTSRAFADGRFVFRTGWDDVNDTYVTITANEWHRSPWGMSPNYPGGFTVDRKGPQVIRQGGFSGHDWGSSGAGPSNVLIFVDTAQSPPSSQYDDQGGHRYQTGSMRGSIDFVPNGQNDLRDEVRFLPADGGRAVDYVYVDVTRAYSSTRFHDAFNPPRVSEVIRHFVYFRPDTPGMGSDRLVLLDRATTTNSRYEKRWLFHTSGEPAVNGSVQPGVPIRNGSGGGKWTYTGSSLVTATNTVDGSNGRTFLTPLLPAARTIVKVGGPNAAGRSWEMDSHEFESPFGIITPRYGVPDSRQEAYIGRYRVELIPAVPALTDIFLNVVEVGDADMPAPTPASLLQGNGMIAARVGDRIAAFSATGAVISTAQFTVDHAGMYGIHIADLQPCRAYEVSIGGIIAVEQSSTAGTVYVVRNLPAGSTVTIRVR